MNVTLDVCAGSVQIQPEKALWKGALKSVHHPGVFETQASGGLTEVVNEELN